MNDGMREDRITLQRREAEPTDPNCTTVSYSLQKKHLGTCRKYQTSWRSEVKNTGGPRPVRSMDEREGNSNGGTRITWREHQRR